jgi:hypothetical protein
MAKQKRRVFFREQKHENLLGATALDLFLPVLLFRTEEQNGLYHQRREN